MGDKSAIEWTDAGPLLDSRIHNAMPETCR